MQQYYILSQQDKFKEVVEWLDTQGCWYEVHLNRTRFTIEQGHLLTEFMLLYSEHIGTVDPRLDLLTGLPQSI